ncbi:MAG: SCO family protein [Acidobacteria bacterium]|nr:SCO family protein [Acidobacteriota bacterium]MCA1612487.1 SCO family protein [Acidobacteriota bacterium]
MRGRALRRASFPAALAAALLLLAGVAGCRRGDPAAGEEPAAVKRYPFHGIVREVKNGGADVLVQHDAVPGFMGAMTMLFPTRGAPEVARALAAGDSIDATLVVEESRYWLEGIRRRPGSGPPRTPVAAASPEPPSPGAVTPVPNRAVRLGERIPDFELIDQASKPVKLSSLRGEPVAVTFLYTRCPVATACPMTTAKFSRLDALLKQKGYGRLLVVTVDPEHDTPAVLADYAKKAGADGRRWRFLTGSPAAVADVASSFGVLYYPERGQVIHGQAVAVVGPDGRLSSIYYGESWEPEHLLRDIEKARKG